MRCTRLWTKSRTTCATPGRAGRPWGSAFIAIQLGQRELCTVLDELACLDAWCRAYPRVDEYDAMTFKVRRHAA